MMKATKILLLILLSIKTIYSAVASDISALIELERDYITALTTIAFKLNHTGISVGRSMSLVFHTQMPMPQNTNHYCFIYDYPLAPTSEMSCKSNNDVAKNEWTITINTKTLPSINCGPQIVVSIPKIQLPERVQSIAVDAYFSIDGVEKVYSLPSKVHIKPLKNVFRPSIVFSNPTNRANSDWVYTIEFSHTLTYHLELILDFPKYKIDNSTISSINQINYPTDPDYALTLTNLQGFSSEAALVKLSDSRFNIINAFKNGIKKGDKASFTLTNMVVPDVINKAGFKMMFLDDNKEIPIENDYNVTCPQQGKMEMISVVASTTRLNWNATVTIKLKTDRKIPHKSGLQILTPKDVSFYDHGTVSCIENCMPTPLLHCKNNGWHFLNIEDEPATILTLSNLFYESPAEETHTIFIDFLIVPYELRLFEMQFVLIDDQKDILSIATSTFSMQTTVSWFDNILFEPQTNVVGEKGNIVVSYKNTVFLEENTIELEFSNDYLIEDMDKKDCIEPITGFDFQIQCEVVNNILYITDTYWITNEAKVKFTIPNVRNPLKVKESYFTMTSLTKNREIMTFNDKLTYPLVGAPFKSITCTPDNKQNDALTDYNFRLKLSVPIGLNGRLEMIFPNEFTLNSGNVCNDGFACVIDGQKVTISKEGLDMDGVDDVVFALIKMKNLRSMKRSEDIVLKSYSSDDYLVNEDSFTITNTIPLELENTSIVPSDYTIHKTVLYSVDMTIKGDIIKGDKIYMIIPEDIQLVNENVVIEGKGTLKTSLENTITTTPNENSHLLIIIIDFNEEGEKLSKGDKITFTIDGLINPTSTKPSASFEIDIKTTEDYLLMTLTTPIIITVDPNELSIAVVYPKEHNDNLHSDFIVYFKPNNPLITSDKIIIEYPKEVTQKSSYCINHNDAIESITVGHDASIRKITIVVTMALRKKTRSSLNDNLYTFELPDMEALIPQAQVKTSSFKIYTTTSQDHKIDQYPNSLTVSSICNYPCETCEEGSVTTCTKCLPNGIETILLNGQCYTDCPDNYTVDPEGACVKCDASCRKCSYPELTICTSCLDSLPFFDNGVCLDECPFDMYSLEDKVCLDCSSNCGSCINSATECTSCSTTNDFQYLYNKQCEKQCPLNTFEKNKRCIDCDANCKTCSNLPEACTSCSSSLFLLNKACVDDTICRSEDNYYGDTVNNLCLKCQEGCIMCGDGVDKCLDCDGAFVLKDNKCLPKVESCIDGYFLTSEKLCEKCDIDACSQCHTTATTCTKCHEGLILHENECLDDCPLNYVEYENKCVTECPEGYEKDEQSSKCLPSIPIVSMQKENLKYFFRYQVSNDYFLPFTFFLLTIIISGIIKLVNRTTIFFAYSIPFMTIFSNISLILLFTYSFFSAEISYFYPIALIFLLGKLINYTFMIIYTYMICHENEVEKWIKSNNSLYITSYLLMHFIDFKMMRLNFSYLFTSPSFTIECSSYKNIEHPYKIASYVELGIVNAPMIAMCIYIIASYQEYSFLYYLAIENIIIFSLLTIMMLCDIFINSNWDTFLNQSKKKKVVLTVPELKITTSIKDEDKKIEYSEVANTRNTKTTSLQHLESTPSKNTPRDFSSRNLCQTPQKTLENAEDDQSDRNHYEDLDDRKKTVKENDRYDALSLENQNTDRENNNHDHNNEEEIKNIEKQSISSNHHMIYPQRIMFDKIMTPKLGRTIDFPIINHKQMQSFPIALGDIKISVNSKPKEESYEDATINNNDDSS